MYKFIGADGQQYGPVNLDQMRRWLAENRLNAQTLIQPEGSTDWKPLGSFPEFAAGGALSPGAAMPPTIGAISSTLSARASNKIPAGVCGILLGGFGIHKFILGYTGAGLIMLLATLLTCGALGIVTHIIGLIEGII